MTPGSALPADAGLRFVLGDADDLADVAARLLPAGADRPGILALGEPTHLEPAFPAARNRLLRALVDRGVRSVALETVAVAARRAADYVHGRADDLDDALAAVSHGFGRLPATRELLTWLRRHNAGHPPERQVALHGFDAPIEMTSAPGPRAYLARVHGVLTRHAGADVPVPAWADLDRLLGDDDRWSRTEAVMSAAAERTSRLLGVRDALMAEHLLAVRDRERGRGPTLVFAHNRHLQRGPSTWRLAGMDLRWSGAGAVLAAVLGDGYAFVAGSLGASYATGLAAPAADTAEGLLQAFTGGGCGLVDAAPLRAAARAAGVRERTDAGPEQGYFPLDAGTLDGADAVLHLTADPAGLRVDDVTARVAALADVAVVVTDEASGVPESVVGSRFFFVGAERMTPFATVVQRDVPGWDEASRVDRPGVFRLNVRLGRERFERAFGYPPARFEDHRAEVDFTALDRLVPHPAYGRQGWAAVLNPGPASLATVDELLRHAHAAAQRREERRQEREARREDPPTATGRV
jgi:erythromycin esterase-like protein